MAAMNACHARFRRGSVVPARAGLPEKRTWSTKFEMRSPRYMTEQGALKNARALSFSLRGAGPLCFLRRGVRMGTPKRTDAHQPLDPVRGGVAEGLSLRISGHIE